MIERALTSDGDLAGGLVVALLAELLDLAGVLAAVLHRGLPDLQALLARVVLDDEARIGHLDLLAVLVPLHLRLGVVRLALQLQLPLRLPRLLLVQLLLEAELRVGS